MLVSTTGISPGECTEYDYVEILQFPSWPFKEDIKAYNFPIKNVIHSLESG